MKKIIALALALCLFASLAACGGPPIVEDSGTTPIVEDSETPPIVKYSGNLTWDQSNYYYNDDDGTFNAITTKEGITLTSDTDHRFLIDADNEGSWSIIVDTSEDITLKVEGGKFTAIAFYGVDDTSIGGTSYEPTNEVIIPGSAKNDYYVTTVWFAVTTNDGQLFIDHLDRNFIHP